MNRSIPSTVESSCSSVPLRLLRVGTFVVGAVSAGGLLLTGMALVAAVETGNLGLIGAAAIGVIFTALALSAFLCLRGGAGVEAKISLVEVLDEVSAAATDAPQLTRGNVASPFSCSSRSRVL